MVVFLTCYMLVGEEGAEHRLHRHVCFLMNLSNVSVLLMLFYFIFILFLFLVFDVFLAPVTFVVNSPASPFLV